MGEHLVGLHGWLDDSLNLSMNASMNSASSDPGTMNHLAILNLHTYINTYILAAYSPPLCACTRVPLFPSYTRKGNSSRGLCT